MTIASALKTKANQHRIMKIEMLRKKMCDKQGMQLLKRNNNFLDPTHVSDRSCNRGNGVVLMCKLIWKTADADVKVDDFIKKLNAEFGDDKFRTKLHRFDNTLWRTDTDEYKYINFWLCVF